MLRYIFTSYAIKWYIELMVVLQISFIDHLAKQGPCSASLWHSERQNVRERNVPEIRVEMCMLVSSSDDDDYDDNFCDSGHLSQGNTAMLARHSVRTLRDTIMIAPDD
jgi:hypothetical protein